jgi:hypothetical protein
MVNKDQGSLACHGQGRPFYVTSINVGFIVFVMHKFCETKICT